ncbi:MAG: toprim domain-containing protein [Nanoarchaeota archaeon]
MQLQESEINQWIEGVNASEKTIIVEGFKDRKALENIGISNKIIVLNRQPLYKIIEHIASKHIDCIILTDFDKEGKRLYGRLNSELCQKGVRIDKEFREFLQKTTLDQVEGVERFFSRHANEAP